VEPDQDQSPEGTRGDTFRRAVVAALDPSQLGDLSEISIDELRDRRRRCSELELEVSYLRRLAQGRLDLLDSELNRRHDHQNDRPLLERLPSILSDRVMSGGTGRLMIVIAPDVEDPELTAELDAIVDPRAISDPLMLNDAELEQAIRDLSTWERGISRTRRQLHERIDRYQAELVRRYQRDMAQVDELLR
jgi:hypothetical protein